MGVSKSLACRESSFRISHFRIRQKPGRRLSVQVSVSLADASVCAGRNVQRCRCVYNINIYVFRRCCVTLVDELKTHIGEKTKQNMTKVFRSKLEDPLQATNRSRKARVQNT